MNKIIMALKDPATLKHADAYKNLKPIDVSKYNVTESGNVIKSRLEQEAEVFVSEKADKGNFDLEQFGKAYFSESSMKRALVKFAEPREERIAELEFQIKKMKCCNNCRFYRYQDDIRYCTCVRDGKHKGEYRSCKSFILEKWEFNNR